MTAVGSDGDVAAAAILELPLPVRVRRVRASAGPPNGDVEDPVAWLLRECASIEAVGEALDALCWRLVRAGVPITYAHIGTPTLHPQLLALGCRWWQAQRVVEEFEIDRAAEESETFLGSPLRVVILDGVARRFRFEAGEGTDQVLLQSLAGPGTTDLLILPMSRINGYFPFVVWATDVPGGFADEQIGRLQQIMPPMAAVFEVRLARRVTSDLLRVYLGREAGPKVLAGAIRRGQGERRQAVIMAVDLRRSTWLSDHLPALTMIELLLDACFEQICQPVLAEGGDILKFIGDGVLAVFPVGDDARQATRAALAASAAALAGLVQVTRERPEFLLRSPVAGIGLHRGDVFYGNVGAAERLDFTVIGPAVNLAFRIETLTKLLGRPLLLSGQVAASTVPAPVSLGLHSVHGLDEPIEVFAPADRAL